MKLQSLIAAAGNGADINGRGEDGFTPLHSAAENGQLEIVAYLLTKGASVHCLNDDGDTPSECAKTFGYDSILSLLDAFIGGKH